MFESLLDGQRMRVLTDAERGFRVEGVFAMPWMQDAPSEVDSRGGIRSSGGRNRRDESRFEVHIEDFGWAA